jgi:eukaryotic-like serine/threonine-protein kinase
MQSCCWAGGVFKGCGDMKMAKANFWKSDWFVGLIISVVVLFLGNGDLLQSLERKAYDMAVAMTSRTPSDKIAVIAIDDQSIANIGRWPWSREIMADMVEKLSGAKAKVIAPIILYSEPQLDPGLVYVNKLMETCGLTAAASAPQRSRAARLRRSCKKPN